jgi:carbon starvation protein
MTAGVQKIWHSDPRIGFLAQVRGLNEKRPSLEAALAEARSGGETKKIDLAEKALQTNRVLGFNNLLDATVAGAFLVLITAIVWLSIREWLLLLGRRKLAELRESAPVWLPEYALAEAKPLQVASVVALGFALAKELSGEAQLERAQPQAPAQVCQCETESLSPAGTAQTKEQRYLDATERRFNGVRRCC